MKNTTEWTAKWSSEATILFSYFFKLSAEQLTSSRTVNESSQPMHAMSPLLICAENSYLVKGNEFTKSKSYGDLQGKGCLIFTLYLTKEILSIQTTSLNPDIIYGPWVLTKPIPLVGKKSLYARLRWFIVSRYETLYQHLRGR